MDVCLHQRSETSKVLWWLEAEEEAVLLDVKLPRQHTRRAAINNSPVAGSSGNGCGYSPPDNRQPSGMYDFGAVV